MLVHVEKRLIDNIINNCLYYDLQFASYSDDIEIVRNYVGDHYESYDVVSTLYLLLKRIYEVSTSDGYEYVSQVSITVEEFKCVRYALMQRPNRV